MQEQATGHGAAKPLHKLLKATRPRAHALQQEKPPQQQTRAATREGLPLTVTRESPHTAMKTQHSQNK